MLSERYSISQYLKFPSDTNWVNLIVISCKIYRLIGLPSSLQFQKKKIYIKYDIFREF